MTVNKGTSTCISLNTNLTNDLRIGLNTYCSTFLDGSHYCEQNWRQKVSILVDTTKSNTLDVAEKEWSPILDLREGTGFFGF